MENQDKGRCMEDWERLESGFKERAMGENMESEVMGKRIETGCER